MAYSQARSNVCHAGAVLAGLFQHDLVVQINGVSRPPAFDSLRITESLGGDANTCTFTLEGQASVPTSLADVKIGYGAIDNLIFAGNLSRVQRRWLGFEALAGLRFDCAAVDYGGWLANLPTQITRRFENVGVNVIVATLIADHTEGGFRPGSLPSSLGNLTIQFTGVTFTGALERIAAAVGGYYLIDYDRYVHVFLDRVDGNALAIGDATRGLEDCLLAEDGSQVRTRVRVQGGGGQTSAAVSGAAATIPVTQCGWYNQAGGTVVIEQSEVTYTGVSAASGPGNLTGCTGLAADVAEGTDVDLLVTANSSAGQTALAAALATTDPSHSGIAVHYVVDRRLSLSEATARAAAELAYHSLAERDLTYAIDQGLNGNALHTLAGKAVSVAVTEPETLTATFRIQQVTFELYAPVAVGAAGGGGGGGGSPASGVAFRRRVSMQVHRRTIADLLAQLR